MSRKHERKKQIETSSIRVEIVNAQKN